MRRMKAKHKWTKELKKEKKQTNTKQKKNTIKSHHQQMEREDGLQCSMHAVRSCVINARIESLY